MDDAQQSVNQTLEIVEEKANSNTSMENNPQKIERDNLSVAFGGCKSTQKTPNSSGFELVTGYKMRLETMQGRNDHESLLSLEDGFQLADVPNLFRRIGQPGER